MHKLYLVLLLVGILLLCGCMEQMVPKTNDTITVKNGSITNVENLGGKYDAKINTRTYTYLYEGKTYGGDIKDIEYTVEGKTYTRGYFDEKYRPAMEWIKGHTPDYAKFLTWWDYGHMIRGYAERGAVIYGPSQDILWTIYDKSNIKEFEPSEKTHDVARAFTTDDPEEMKSVMKKYGATYVLVTSDDVGKFTALLNISGKNPLDYMVYTNGGYGFTEKGTQTMMYRLLNEKNTSLTSLLKDYNVKVYKLPS